MQEVRNAYTATLTNDLSNKESEEDQVNGFNNDIIVKHSNGTYIKISKAGEATVVSSGTETHTLANGMLVKKSNETGNNSTSETPEN